MDFKKRIWLRLIRNYKQSLAMGGVIFLLGVLLAGTVIAMQAAAFTEENVRRRIPPVVSITLDGAKIDEVGWLEYLDLWGRDGLQRIDEVMLEPIHNLGQKFPLEVHQVSQIQEGHFDIEAYVPLVDPSEEFREIGILTTRGSSNQKPLIFRTGDAHLREGQFLPKDRIDIPDPASLIPAMISTPLADLNALGIGSIIAMANPWGSPSESPSIYPPYEGLTWTAREMELIESVTFQLEVVGIFDVDYLIHDDSRDAAYVRDLALINNIFVPLWFNQIYREASFEAFIAAWGEEVALNFASPNSFSDVRNLIVLDDPLDLENFLSALEPSIPEFFLAQSLSPFYADQLGALSQVRDVFQWVFWGTCLGIILIIGLLMMIFIQDRKFEVGLYLALGCGRDKLLMEVIVETLLIFLFSTSLALFVGHGMSFHLSHRLLQEQIPPPTTDWLVELEHHLTFRDVEEVSGAMLSRISDQELMEMFESPLTPEMFFLFYIAGGSAILLATLFPLFYLVRLQPKKLLL